MDLVHVSKATHAALVSLGPIEIALVPRGALQRGMEARTLAVAAVVLLAACARSGSPGPGPALSEIARIENSRSAASRLGSLSIEKDARVRARALRAMGRLQDPASLGAMLHALGDEDAGVRREAAFAVELLGLSWEPLEEPVRARAELAIRAALAVTKPEERAMLYAALGAVAGDGSGAGEKGASVLAGVLGDADPRVAEAAARALGNWIYRSKKKGFAIALPDGVGTVFGIGKMGATDVAVRRARAYLLMRAALPETAEMLGRALSDPDAEVRALSAKGLAAQKNKEHLRALGRAAITDEDWRVRVEAVRALGAACTSGTAKDAAAHLFKLAMVAAALWSDRELYDQPELAAAIVELSTEQGFSGTVPGEGAMSSMVLSAAFESSAPVAVLGDAAAAILPGLARARAVGTDMHARDLARLECGAAVATDRAAGTLDEVKRCGGPLTSPGEHEQLAARALEYTAFPMREIELLKLLHSADKRTRARSIEALGKSEKDRIGDEARRFVREALADTDGALVATAADAEATLLDAAAVPALLTALGRYPKPEDTEIAQSIVAALGALKATSAEAVLRPLATGQSGAGPALRLAAKKALVEMGFAVAAAPMPPPPAPARLEPPVESRLRLITEKGEIVIALFRDDAPVTVRTLADLARAGFFNGLRFHRVVPDFVAQGGDPRGDGWGGPGYTIRCELNPLRYLRGTVGMALSGKDTGGSQFFITHSMQPHLEGRYTIFGQVISGMEVVDRLLPGDRILKASVEK